MMHLPTLFSAYFNIPPEKLDDAGLIDPFVDLDLPLFIDPLLLEKSSNSIIASEGIDAFRTHFEVLVRLLTVSEKEGDTAWRTAEKHLSLKEPPENGLGYGRRGRSGNSRPSRIRLQVLRTTKDIIKVGSKDPELISLMSFLEEDVGSDTISDLTTRALSDQLCQLTSDFCANLGIPINKSDDLGYSLPTYEAPDGRLKPMVLIPKDIVRDLPVTDSWADVWEATQHNVALRDKVNKLLGGIAQPTIKEQKAAVRSAVLQSSTIFEQFLNAVKSAASSYDQNEDIFGFYRFRDALINNKIITKTVPYDIKKGPNEIHKIVLDAVGAFQHHVEKGNLWEALWADNTPKRERASQLIFYAIADAYCKAHDIDLSAEPNMGGGPVDFKFSTGYTARVLVEMKRSSGTVEHGYNKQLEFYKDAAKSEFAIFVVIDYGDGHIKIKNIEKVRDEKISRGERASELIVIDAGKKLSASKRK